MYVCVCAGSSYGKGKVYYGMGVENRIALVVFFRQLDEMAFNGIFMRCHSANSARKCECDCPKLAMRTDKGTDVGTD